MDNTYSEKFSALMDKYSPFLEEARKRLIFASVLFVVSTISGFIFYEDIIRFLVKFLSLEGVNIVFTSPFQFINLSISCGIATGLVTVVPLLIFQILSFLKPALKRSEFRILTKMLPFSIFLFVVGFVFGVFIMKWQIEIFLSRSVSLNIGNILDITGLLSTILLTASLMGLGFQFPIILLVLMRFGIINSEQLSQGRLWVYLGSFIFAMLLPPDSILADVILSLPLIILFEAVVILDRFLIRKKKPDIKQKTLSAA